MAWLIESALEGAHVVVKVRSGRVGSRALLGTLVMRVDEWSVFADLAKRADWEVQDYRAGDDGKTPREKLTEWDRNASYGRAQK